MIRRLRWTPAAADDLEATHSFLNTTRGRDIAKATVTQIYRDLKLLTRFPELGRVIAQDGDIRQFFLTPLPYVVIYRLRYDAVELLHIFHIARSRTDLLQ